MPVLIKRRAKPKPPEGPTLDLADRMAPKIERALYAALKAHLAALPEDSLAQAVGLGDEGLVAYVCGVADFPAQTSSTALAKEGVVGLRQRLSDSGFALVEGETHARGAQLAQSSLGVGVSFDLKDQRSVDFATQRGGVLITAIGEDTRTNIRGLLAQAQSEGITPVGVARRIKNDNLIGLHPRQARAVQNYRTALTQAMLDGSGTSAVSGYALSPWRGGRLTPDKIDALVGQ